MRQITFFLFWVTAFMHCYGQNNATYEILRVISNEIPKGTPVLDSLCPLQYLNITGKDLSFFKKKALKQVKRGIKKAVGIGIDKDSVKNIDLIVAKPILELFDNLDSLNLKKMEAIKPFCIISAPIFFDDSSKAIIAVDVIGGYGYTYLLHKTDSGWMIKKEFFRWMV